MTDTKEFPTMSVVSAYTGFLLCDIGDIYEVLDYVLGRSHFTHQLPAAVDEARPHMDTLHPWLKTIKMPKGNLPAMEMIAIDIIAKHGTTLTLTPKKTT